MDMAAAAGEEEDELLHECDVRLKLQPQHGYVSK